MASDSYSLISTVVLHFHFPNLSSSDSSSNEDDKESKEPDYDDDDDEKSDKEGEENQGHGTNEITINQVFWLLLSHIRVPVIIYKSGIEKGVCHLVIIIITSSEPSASALRLVSVYDKVW